MMRRTPIKRTGFARKTPTPQTNAEIVLEPGEPLDEHRDSRYEDFQRHMLRSIGRAFGLTRTRGPRHISEILKESIVTDVTSTCRACSKSFTPHRTTQVVCSPKCAARLQIIAKEIKKDAAKAERRDTRDRLTAIKPRTQWLKEAQQAFNAWVRARDADLPCVSCGRHHGGQYHAGHYLTVGARPELRFDPRNVHKQCQPCNTHLHGNLVLYRVELIKRIGLEAVEWLEGPHAPEKWSIDELKCMRDGYRIMTKRLLQDQKMRNHA